LLAATFYQGNPDRNHKLWNILLNEIYTPYAGAAGMLTKKVIDKFYINNYCTNTP